MRYQRHYYGPGSIAAMPSGYGLTQPPTISSTDRPRNIPELSGCAGCMGQDEPAQASIAGALPILVPVAIGAAAYYLFFHSR
jgi:hypothetical protein